MSVIHAAGIHVRHALTRALATMNRAQEATWRVLSARAGVDARGRVIEGEVTVRVEAPVLSGPLPPGLVNPDGAHPLMAVVPGHPTLLMDIFPVTRDRYSHVLSAPELGSDPWSPRTGVTEAEANAYARAVGKRLPTTDEYRAAWGTERWPWGARANPELGLAAPSRFGELPEVGTHPPSPGGFYDLGAWLHQWTAEGLLLGGVPGLVPGDAEAEPRGLRCVCDA